MLRFITTVCFGAMFLTGCDAVQVVNSGPQAAYDPPQLAQALNFCAQYNPGGPCVQGGQAQAVENVIVRETYSQFGPPPPPMQMPIYQQPYEQPMYGYDNGNNDGNGQGYDRPHHGGYNGESYQREQRAEKRGKDDFGHHCKFMYPDENGDMRCYSNH